MSEKNKFADLVKKFCSTQKKTNSILNVKVKNVIKVNNVDYLLVDTGLKYDGIIAISEFSTIPAIGESITAVLLSEKVVENYCVLSNQKAKFESIVQKLKKNINYPVSGKIVQVLERGYKVDVMGIVGFLQADQKFELDQIIECYVNNITNNTVTFTMKKANYCTLAEGSIVNAVIKSINPALIIVDILLDKKEKIEGIIDINDSVLHKTSGKSGDLQVGDKITAKVLKIENNNIILNLKDFLVDKWAQNVKKYTVGQDVDCVILKFKTAGVVVDINGEIDGFVHNTEAANSKTRILSNQLFKIGDKQKAKILEINTENQTIKLSFRPFLPPIFDAFTKQYKIGDKVKCRICNSTAIFIFARIENTNVDGVIHSSELSWNPEENAQMFKELQGKKGQIIEAMISDIILEKNHVLLTVKQLKKDPFKDFEKIAPIGTKYECTLIEKVLNGGFLVKVGNLPYRGFIKKTDISYENKKKININQVFTATLIGFDNMRRSLNLSLKEDRQPVVKAMEISLSDLLNEVSND